MEDPMMLKIIDDLKHGDVSSPSQPLVDPALLTCLSMVASVFEDWGPQDFKTWKPTDFEPPSPIAEEQENDTERKLDQEMREAWENDEVQILTLHHLHPRVVRTVRSPVSVQGDGGVEKFEDVIVFQSYPPSPPSPPPPSLVSSSPHSTYSTYSTPPSLDLCMSDSDEATFDTLETPILIRALTV